jgi:DNA polymerase-3 subunit alpha
MHGKDFNRRAIESLIKCGAFDGLGANRRQMFDVIDTILDDLENSRRRNVDGQIGFGDLTSSYEEATEVVGSNFSYPEVDEYSTDILLKYEKEVAGMYLSGHPMKKYDAISKGLNCAQICDISGEESTKYKDNDRVTVLGLICSVKKKITKNDSTMAFVNLEDTTGGIEVIVFPKTLLAHPSLFYEGNVLLLHGRISMREDEETKIICEVVEPCPSEESIKAKQEKEKKKAKGLFLRFDTETSPQVELCAKLLKIFDGTVPLYYFFNDKKEYKRNPIGQAIDVNPVLLRELRKILGESNVIYNE